MPSNGAETSGVAQMLFNPGEHFRLAFDKAPIAMTLISLSADHLGRILRANDVLCQAAGLPRQQLHGMLMSDLLHPLEREEHHSYLHRAMNHAEEEPSGVERRFLCADGSTWWGRKHTSVLTPAKDSPAQLLVSICDVTGYRQRQLDLQAAALHDTLTGLGNRTLLLDRIEHALAADKRLRHGVTVLYLDLDGFKAVNDTYGHAAGDALLVEVGRRLSTVVRGGDTVGRLGGDEFVIVCPGMPREQVHRLTDRIRTAFSAPARLVWNSGPISVGIGISIGSATSAHPGHLGDATDGHGLLQAADVQMYRHKRSTQRTR